MEGNFAWINFYIEFADKLRQFRNNRDELIDTIYHSLTDAGINPPTLELNKERPTDIDPFTVFGLFNKGITNQKRTAITSAFFKRLSMKSPAPDSFDGIPILDNRNATFYRFKDTREDGDIERLWKLFDDALDYADKETNDSRARFVESYERVRQQKRILWNITMGLFWIRPLTFLNLDGRNRWFLADSGEWPNLNGIRFRRNKLISAEDYLSLISSCKHILESGEINCNTLPELSHKAWTTANEVNRQIKELDSPDDKSTSYLIDDYEEHRHYWIYSPGPDACKWDEFLNDNIMGMDSRGIGDISRFNSKERIREEIKSIRTDDMDYGQISGDLWRFAHVMSEGDIIFVKRGTKTIIGRGVVSSNYIYDENYGTFGNIRKVEWTHHGQWEHPGNATTRYLAEITKYPNYVTELNNLFKIDDDLKDRIYTKKEFLERMFIDAEDYDRIVNQLRRKGNIILQGPPGVGKTFMAKDLAYSMIGIRDASRVMMIQFHQSYSYEDFIIGFRPSKDGFELSTGPFYDFCKKAADDIDNDYFFIIDEINRGNLSKIFGEMFVLIEKSMRGTELPLLYSGEPFTVPENLYIIGTMNTADRSLALIDYALRRRFSFFNIPPAFEGEPFRRYCDEMDNTGYSNLVRTIRELNYEIEKDPSLGRGFRIGHSYLCTNENVDDDWLKSVILYDIVPLLEEYWFDDQSKVNEWKKRLLDAIQ